VGDEIRADAGGFRQLSDAFLDEIEQKFTNEGTQPDRAAHLAGSSLPCGGARLVSGS
jgi:hypothetical protein